MQIDKYIMKKTILAAVLNILFGGVGYFYIKETSRVPLALFLIYGTVLELVHNIAVLYSPVLHNTPYAIHPLPMLSLFETIPGWIILTIMTFDIYFLVRRHAQNEGHSQTTVAKAT